MNKDDVIRMAWEAGVNLKDAPEKASGVGNAIVSYYDLKRFAALVAAAERDACAKVAWDYGWRRPDNGDVQSAAVEIHDAIRARGTT